MCGIAGLVTQRPDPLALERMLVVLDHRGPDDLGTYFDGGAALGTTRLSIIDFAGGRQPMQHAESGVVIAFNGEVFNHPELRAELARSGFRFHTRSDTEVVLALYLEHGAGFAKRLNGQFAISIWDPRDRKLLLARDRFGICPLFYHHQEGSFAFASELKAILTLPHVRRRLDLRALDQIFTFWTTVVGRTVIEDVLELPPGHTLELRDGRVTLRTYWAWPFPERSAQVDVPFSDAVDEFREHLSRSVELRLRADVEVGSYLSGGVDSSAIVALAAPRRPDRLRTYSVAFADASYDERTYQEQVARHCSTMHTTVECMDADVEASFEQVVWSSETPLFRSAPAPMHLLSRRVRKDGLKVVLSGEGADEVLLGYDIFKEVKVRRFWQRQPQSQARPQLLKRLYSYLPHFADPRFASLAIESFRKSLHSESPLYSHLVRWTNNAANKVYLSEQVSSELQGCDPLDDLRASLPDAFFAADDVERAQYLEISTLLRGYLLSSQGDRMSMGNSVEQRFPYLDHELVAFANRLPRSYKLAGLRDKRVLRESMRGLLPADIVGRAKFAYQAPEIRAFIGRISGAGRLANEYLSDEAIASTGLFDPESVRLLRRKIELSSLSRLGTRDNMAFVLMLSAQIFHRQFIASDMPALAASRVAVRHARTA
jgi:asparagine synthase (glutamine-hydrolysing)